MKEINVRKLTNQKFKKHLSYSFAYGAFFAFIVLSCFVLAFFLPFTLFITIPIIIIPFAFAFQYITSMDNNIPVENNSFSLKKFFVVARGYFTPQMFGVYRLLEGLLKSIGIFFGVYLFSGLVLIETIAMNDPEILSLISSIENMTDMANIENEILNVVMQNETVINCLYIALAIAIFPALLMFLHHIGTHSIKIHLSVASLQKIPMREVHFVHRLGFPTFRKQFYKDYYKTVWWFIPSMAILYYSGMTLSYFFLYKTPFEMGIVGGALVLLFLSFAAPYYFSCIETLFFKYQTNYIKASISQSVKTLNELKAQKQMSEEEAKELEQYINQTNELLEQNQKEEEKEQKEEEQKNSDNSEP